MTESQKRIINDVVNCAATEQARKLFRTKIDEQISSLYGGTCTTSTDQQKAFTLDDMRRSMEPLKASQRRLEEDARNVVKYLFDIDVSGDVALRFAKDNPLVADILFGVNR